MIHRSFIRRIITSNLINLIYDETEEPFGSSEFLELIGSIIVGFAVPLKGEHKSIFE